MIGQAWRILVIEDNPTNLELLMFLLRACGHEPVAARDGVTGIQRAVDLLPDLIICDIQLPTIDGYEVARRIKAHQQLRDITLIAVTACAMPADRERALAAGFDGYISKPITPYTFCDEITRFLPNRKVATQWVASSDSATNQPIGTRLPFPDTILIAEHSAVNLSVLEAVLRPRGRPYTVARTVGEALETLRSNQPPMLIVELDLPGGGAEMLVQRHRQAANRPPSPNLVLAPAGVDDDALASLARLEHCDVMHWPIDPAALIRWIDSHKPVMPLRGAGACT